MDQRIIGQNTFDGNVIIRYFVHFHAPRLQEQLFLVEITAFKKALNAAHRVIDIEIFFPYNIYVFV